MDTRLGKYLEGLIFREHYKPETVKEEQHLEDVEADMDHWWDYEWTQDTPERELLDSICDALNKYRKEKSEKTS